jgi:hypothetical protein
MSEDQAPPAAPPKPQRELSLEEEERAMHTGGWKLPVMLGIMAVGIIGGIAWFVMQGSAVEEVESAAGQLNRLHTEHFVAFYGCAKVPHEMRQYKTMEDVTRRMAKNSWGSEKRYAGYVKSKCIPQFGNYGSQVAAMETPADMQGEVRDLAEKIRDLRSSWEEYIRYLDRAVADEEAHMQAAVPVAKALAEYTVARNKLAMVVNKLRGQE